MANLQMTKQPTLCLKFTLRAFRPCFELEALHAWLEFKRTRSEMGCFILIHRLATKEPEIEQGLDKKVDLSLDIRRSSTFPVLVLVLVSLIDKRIERKRATKLAILFAARLF